MAGRVDAVRDAVKKHGLSQGAVEALWEALVRGGGRQAQFSHPDLGGMGQWSGGGMVQIGDMFNNDLKNRVAAACADLSDAAGDQGHQQGDGQRSGGDGQGSQHRDWWPQDLGRPSTSGSQNATRYAYFPDTNRLAIEENGSVKVYDTGGHRISGVAQSQSRGHELSFTSQNGTVDLGSLTVVDG